MQLKLSQTSIHENEIKSSYFSQLVIINLQNCVSLNPVDFSWNNWILKAQYSAYTTFLPSSQREPKYPDEQTQLATPLPVTMQRP